MLPTFWWSYITVFLCFTCYPYIYIYQLQIIIFLSMSIFFFFNQRSPFNWIANWNRNPFSYPFLIWLPSSSSIPRTSRFTRSIIHFSIYTFDLLPRTIHSLLRHSIRYILRSKERMLARGFEPSTLGTVWTYWRISPLDHVAPLNLVFP